MMKSLGAAVRISNGRPPAARTASFTTFATPSRWAKQIASSDELLTTAIFGFCMSASDRPSALHCARLTASRVVPGSKLLRRARRLIGDFLTGRVYEGKMYGSEGHLLSYQTNRSDRPRHRQRATGACEPSPRGNVERHHDGRAEGEGAREEHCFGQADLPVLRAVHAGARLHLQRDRSQQRVRH